MKLLEYIKIETWDVNPDNTTGMDDGVAFYSTFVLPENKEKYEVMYPDEEFYDIIESSDIQGYDEVEWMTHPEYFYQVTVKEYNFEQYAKEHGLI